MNFQSGLKLLLASAVAACCVSPAGAQSVVTELTGNIQSFHGGWTGPSSEIGQSVTLDFAYDASTATSSVNGTLYSLSAPITSAEIVAGILGSGINLEPDGAGHGTAVDSVDLQSGAVSASAFTSVHAPSPGFTGDVYGFSFHSNGPSSDLDLIRDVYSHGHLDRKDSGTADLSHVVVGQVQAPEIDPASALSGLTLLIGGLAVVRGRKSVGLQSA
ncbi:MAG: hypothetical protein ACYDAH_10085 [Steroidobacteraceae bacterium]